VISCKEVSRVLMTDELQGLRGWKRMEVRLHLAMCGLCSRLARQLKQMRSAAKSAGATDNADAGLEERLIRRLSDE
jgi:hypothetical protein